MFENPTTREQLISLLRILAMREPTSREELSTLQNDCALLVQHIQSTPSLGHEIPESVWHFLSDPDVRFKDPRYAEMQLAGFRLALAKWEHKVAP